MYVCLSLNNIKGYSNGRQNFLTARKEGQGMAKHLPSKVIIYVNLGVLFSWASSIFYQSIQKLGTLP